MSQLLREVPRDKATAISEDTDLELFELDEVEDKKKEDEDLLIG
jgi:hypothetical protein